MFILTVDTEQVMIVWFLVSFRDNWFCVDRFVIVSIIKNESFVSWCFAGFIKMNCYSLYQLHIYYDLLYQLGVN